MRIRQLSLTIGVVAFLCVIPAGGVEADSVSVLKSPRGSDEEVRLDMRVSLQKEPHGKYIVRVKLTNSHTSAASVIDYQLPWLAPNEFMLVPEGNRLDATNSKMRRGGPFADYNGTEYRIGAGESIEEDIVLDGLFPTIVEDIRRYGVRIRWACKSKNLHLTCKQGKGGTFIIPKGGLP